MQLDKPVVSNIFGLTATIIDGEQLLAGVQNFKILQSFPLVLCSISVLQPREVAEVRDLVEDVQK